MLEKMYADFVSNVLPKVQEGLVITKDYFMDLFGRYVQYLLVIDSVLLALSVLGVVLAPYTVYKFKAWIFEEDTYGLRVERIMPLSVVLSIIFIVSFIGLFENGANLAKDIYIPEVRVYEELKNFQK